MLSPLQGSIVDERNETRGLHPGLSAAAPMGLASWIRDRDVEHSVTLAPRCSVFAVVLCFCIDERRRGQDTSAEGATADSLGRKP